MLEGLEEKFVPMNGGPTNPSKVKTVEFFISVGWQWRSKSVVTLWFIAFISLSELIGHQIGNRSHKSLFTPQQGNKLWWKAKIGTLKKTGVKTSSSIIKVKRKCSSSQYCTIYLSVCLSLFYLLFSAPVRVITVSGVSITLWLWMLCIVRRSNNNKRTLTWTTVTLCDSGENK